MAVERVQTRTRTGRRRTGCAVCPATLWRALACVGGFLSAFDAAGATSVRPDQIREAYDVVVVGAGTGGLAAAMQAARMGATVLLVEPTDWIGGQMAAAGVTSMDEGYPPRDRLRKRGIYSEFCRRASAYYSALGKSTDTSAVSEDHFAVEPNVAQRILYDMLRDTRLTPQPPPRRTVLDLALETEVTRVLRTGCVVVGAELRCHRAASSPVECTVRSRVLIDATEYGDVLALAGAPFRVGIWRSDEPPTDPARVPPVQPITWTAVIKQYPEQAPAELLLAEPPPGYRPEAIRPFLDDPGTGTSRQPWSWERFLKYRGMPDSLSPVSAHNGSGLALTRTHVNFPPNDEPMSVVDLQDPARRRAVEARARLRTLAVLYYAQHELGRSDWSVADDVGYDTPFNRRQTAALIADHPELEPYRAVLERMPVIPYVRESRRIVGTAPLRARDIRRKAPYRPVAFASAVALGDYPVDVHGEHVDRDLQVELDLDEAADLPEKWIQWGYGPFQIPLEAFLPQELDGFLPAEKNLAQSRLASGATRLQPVTMLTGQAAGALAAWACRLETPPREVPALRVQRSLLQAGSTLATTYYHDLPHGTELWQAVQLASVYGALDYPEPEFRETRRVSAAEVQEAVVRLQALELPGADETWRGSLEQRVTAATRGDLARAIAAALLATLDPPTAADQAAMADERATIER